MQVSPVTQEQLVVSALQVDSTNAEQVTVLAHEDGVPLDHLQLLLPHVAESEIALQAPALSVKYLVQFFFHKYQSKLFCNQLSSLFHTKHHHLCTIKKKNHILHQYKSFYPCNLDIFSNLQVCILKMYLSLF
ncbi:hypothetical protein TTHERM_00196630 (macronuclear) [Tetrahymena thermophila SB210]|uniref:Uncharacterized protein n=1 Tax=Tetrahymena thermophila (strain SB210) TaxID=312017 RepID=Q23JX1_TETTS|nr:hypothetical protein TTHERM_00196630 [Tetrahymena thermophila SB210]EAR97072.2 hypothetical protein TTHERM_00196630 [Tetrahymena thermophila SB210]|eukprot:XP_001017317.2 hypothetical protein TTHERM_00196630 [Tetrahymena thermophila SB210]